jgi:hypothetical protein
VAGRPLLSDSLSREEVMETSRKSKFNFIQSQERRKRMPSYTLQNTPIEFEDEQLGGSRASEAGDFTVAFETWKAGADTRPIFKGLPGDSCQAPHWGYLLKGKCRILGPDGEEMIEAPAAYYLPPGHNVVVDEDIEILEFTPTAERNRTMEHVATVMAGTQ